MTPVVQSRGGVPIRLTAERWTHIVEEHAELAGMREEVLETVTDAERVVEGQGGELLAVRTMEQGRAMVVVYREVEATDMAPHEIAAYLDLVPALLRSPHQYIWSSYDAEADVLYINFKKPARATDSELTDDDVIIRYEDDEVIGLTILHASKRKPRAA